MNRPPWWKRLYLWLRFDVLGLPPSRRMMRKYSSEVTPEVLEHMWQTVKAKMERATPTRGTEE